MEQKCQTTSRSSRCGSRKLQKHLDEIKVNEASKAKDAERAQQLLFEKEQCDKTTKKLNTDQTQTKLSIITPFGGAHILIGFDSGAYLKLK